jgi:hypothetical protein
MRGRHSADRAGGAADIAVDMMDNASALPTCPQRQQQEKTAFRKWPKITHTTSRRGKKASHTRAEMIVEILRDYERTGDAMRYVNAKGQIAWKASPWLISRLADAEREVQQDMEEFS